MDNSSLGDRMKKYEAAAKTVLPCRMPVIVRLDGRAWHTWVKKINAQRPFDDRLMDVMARATKRLCESIQGAVFAYTQSDEISILLHNYKRLTSEPWFGNEIQKMVSISASQASSFVTLEYGVETMFDARVFVIPESDVINAFIWRQQDAVRNSIQMLAQSMFSHKELHGKNCDELQEMMFQKDGTNWNNVPVHKKRGTCVYKQDGDWVIDLEPPTFTQNRDFIDCHLAVETPVCT